MIILYLLHCDYAVLINFCQVCCVIHVLYGVFTWLAVMVEIFGVVAWLAVMVEI